MRPSVMNSLTVANALVAASNPTTVIHAGDVPLRVLVRNFGAVVIFLAFDPNDLRPATTSRVYALPVGVSDVFVVMPGQGLYALGATGIGAISTASSEAYPVKADAFIKAG